MLHHLGAAILPAVAAPAIPAAGAVPVHASIPAVVATDVVLSPVGVAGATAIIAAVYGLAVAALFLQHTDFINIVVWRNQAENVSKYCKKGSLVGVTGRIQTGSYQAQDGTTRYTTDVVADNVRFLSSKGSASSEGVDNMPDYSMGKPDSQPADLSEDPYKDFGSEVVLSDDDLPF